MAFVLEKEVDADDIAYGNCTTATVIPVHDGDANQALDAAYEVLTKTELADQGASIVAVFSPVTKDGKITLPKTVLWNWAPPALFKERKNKERQAEESLEDDKYSSKFRCKNCNPVEVKYGGRGMGKRPQPPAHTFFGARSKGGCDYPADLFQVYADEPDLTLDEREELDIIRK
jgi:hypothetical protein